MKTFLLDVLSPEDEEMVLTILEGLRKGNAIRFHPVDASAASPDELRNSAEASLASPRLSWEEGLTQLGL